MWRTDSIALIDLKICKTELFPLNKNIVFEMVRSKKLLFIIWFAFHLYN